MDVLTAAQAKRDQGERFLQLSQRCHEQSWAQVHVLAVAILMHSSDDKTGDEIQTGDESNQKQAALPPSKADLREGSVSISGEVIHLTNDGGDAQEETTNNNNNNAGTDTGDQDQNSNLQDDNALPIHSPAPLPYPAQPRMLSTCLGTASPLAWCCRYSAPSATVKLVLNLDVSSVRRCLPQLGTPLHECLGRPRPLRRMPQKQARWSNLIAGAEVESGSGDQLFNNAKSAKSKGHKRR